MLVEDRWGLTDAEDQEVGRSLLVSSRASECEALEFVDSAADTEGWK